jgi:hypothetical protein
MDALDRLGERAILQNPAGPDEQTYALACVKAGSVPSTLTMSPGVYLAWVDDGAPPANLAIAVLPVAEAVTEARLTPADGKALILRPSGVTFSFRVPVGCKVACRWTGAADTTLRLQRIGGLDGA